MGSLVLSGSLLDRENQAGEISVGLLLSSKPIRDLSDRGLIQKELALDDATGKFGLTYRPPAEWKRIYVTGLCHQCGWCGHGTGRKSHIIVERCAMCMGQCPPTGQCTGLVGEPMVWQFLQVG